MRFQVDGADASTGRDISISIDAADEQDATKQARGQGVFVSRVVRVQQAPAAATRQISGTKLFAIVAGAVAVGIIIALVGVGLFTGVLIHHTTTGASSSGKTSSKLSPTDKAFVDAINDGNVDLVRAYLTDNIDWHAVAQDGLYSIVSYQRLEGGYSETSQNARQFWGNLADRFVKNGADVNAVLHTPAIIQHLIFC